MKKLILLTFMALAVVACSTTRLTPEEKAAKEARKRQQLTENLNDRHFTIHVDYMQPMRGPMKRLTSDYELTLHGDTLISYLPYFGRAYNVPYGGGKGLSFTTLIRDYQVVEGRKDNYLVEIKARNEEDEFVYNIEVFANGNASISVQAHERDAIRFTGAMELEEHR
ncbi:DUF4251 domain-containing protein [Prevotella sp. KH2C16]|uniref:DUF4251 domain-containing protein n=1 Tax=Prevotella sp. KH2C16 TaxID=1855325 RepID=UPI0008E5D456|nr:DUF4251 domain-containing protein [Prevotella sp. KH2C16]SFG26524.1 protein of unknown function [Prevotella sp. KH2C16]